MILPFFLILALHTKLIHTILNNNIFCIRVFDCQANYKSDPLNQDAESTY